MNATKNTSNRANSSSALQMVVLNDHRFAVEEKNGNISFNLSQMAKPYGRVKRPGSWLRTEESETYINALTKAHNCASTDLVQVRHGGRLGEAGTWTTDYKIAVRFAQWLDVNFAIAVDDLVYKLLTKQAAVIEPFMGVWPLVINGKPMYYYRDVLKAVGLSTISGSVYKRIKRFPEQFSKNYHRQFCTLEMCHFLKGEAEQMKRALQLKSNQLNLSL